ncbi:hypothetical protein DFW101_2677 [Solidesulfovibrio carbinoliphilus subsp. oakridgensis]|uniref:Lipoprotein n=1 Tax=Solidesulfovibrio carbinoliphilus subsp. oakridgensis TaxID=694327 RepID=G7Q9P1_9BACT|nr:hypothetical protein [Solidesulfovibrio carbinoliphilus]EHJ48681.1 hypothetical protein DFW101_2677 [Solidesulfovibrio carbinoliphilus subsp. oakridgensis]
MRRHPRLPRALSCLVLGLLLLGGCAVEPKLTDKHVLSVDNYTRRGNPEVYVEPMRSPPTPVSGLVVPFQVTQDMAGSQELGEQLTRIVWQTWTRDRVFPKLLFEPGLRNASTPQAVALARKMGLDTVIVGKFTYVMSGGTRGDSGVSCTFDVIDVRNGERLWSMAHTGTMETGLTEDYIIFTRKNRMPSDPLAAITATLAMDMGGPMTKWNYGFIPPPPAGPNPRPPAPAGPGGAGY